MVSRGTLRSRLICWLAAVWFLHAGLVSAAGSKQPAQPSTSPTEAVAGSLYDQAVSAAGEQQYRRAIELLRQAVTRQPDDADAHNLLGYCLRKNGDIEGAFASYAEALRQRRSRTKPIAGDQST